MPKSSNLNAKKIYLTDKPANLAGKSYTRDLNFLVDNHDTDVNSKSSYFTLKQFSEKHRSLSLRDLSCLHLYIRIVYQQKC